HRAFADPAVESASLARRITCARRSGQIHASAAARIRGPLRENCSRQLADRARSFWSRGMNAVLHVLSPGLLTTVQDLGRHGLQHLGVPVGRALDPVSLRAANALVGNAPGAAALEVAYLGPTLAVEADDVRVGIVGAPAAIDILPQIGAVGGESIGLLRSAK